jgi:hypothetical protein
MALKWKFGADTSPYRRGLNEMKSQTKALAGSLKGMIAGALGFAAIKAGFQAVFREMDRVQKLGLRFNETAETIQKMDVASKLAGAGLEQVAKAIQTVTRNAREARDGVVTYADAFEELGIAPEGFINLPMEEKLRVVARALNDVEGSGDRVGLALDVMGRQGAELLPLLGNIEEALGEDIPVASQKAVDRIAAANDSLTRFGNTVKVVMAEAVSYFAEFAKHGKFFLEEINQASGFTAHTLAQTFGSALKGDLSGAVEGIKGVHKEVVELFKTLNAGPDGGVIADLNDPELQKTMKEFEKTNPKPLGADGITDDDLKREDRIKKLRDKLAKAERDANLRRADTKGKIAILEEEDNALTDDLFGQDEEKKLAAELRTLELSKEIASAKKQLAAEEKADAEELAKLREDFAKQEKERILDEKRLRAEMAAEIREEGLALAAEKQAEADAIDTGPRLKASDLAAVGGGGLAALTDTTAIQERQANLLEEIKVIVASLPGAEETTIDPTT